MAAKEAVIRAAIDVLAETLLAFRMDQYYEEIKTVVTQAITNAPAVDERALMTFAADKLKELLEKKGAHAAPIARTFLAKMKRDLGME